MSASFTPGPWGWFGNARTNYLYLATVHGGRRYVMDFTRWGMRGAQPRFQPGRNGMVDAKDLLQFEVGDRSIVGVDAARRDESVYRMDVRGINCADARLIAAAPDLAEALSELLAIGIINPTGMARLDAAIEKARAALAKALSPAEGGK